MGFSTQPGENKGDVLEKINEYLRHPRAEKWLSFFAKELKDKEALKKGEEEERKRLEEKNKKLEEEVKKLKRGEKHIKMGIHAVTQRFKDSAERTLFSEEKIDTFTRETGLILKTPRPTAYGADLNQSQERVLEGIVRAFSDNNYTGDELIEKSVYSRKTYPVNKIKGAYDNIDKIPAIKLTQADIIRLSGFKKTQGEKTHVIEAIEFLGRKQFCFYWLRLKKDEKGRPVVDSKGKYVCLLYTSPSPRDRTRSRMPSSA